MNFIADEIIQKQAKSIGVYRLIMKHDSDNFRKSSIQIIIDRLHSQGITTIIYEPTLKENNFNGIEVIQDLALFKDVSELIITNRLNDDLADVLDKVYTRDIYNEN